MKNGKTYKGKDPFLPVCSKEISRKMESSIWPNSGYIISVRPDVDPEPACCAVPHT
jgi:hypothetical protein